MKFFLKEKFSITNLIALWVFIPFCFSTAEEITIATVNNSDMIIMQKLSTEWSKKTGHKLNWVILEENALRQRVTIDIATKGGQFDIITIGSYEAPIWGKRGWLTPLDDFGDDYHYEDIFESVRSGLSANGSLYAVPFYAESSFTFYRHDLFDKAGINMPDQPTYDEIRKYAKSLHDPKNNVYGICLRGKAGWGENMAFISTLINTYGGRWFDMEWESQINTKPWSDALNDYVSLLKNYGPPEPSSNGHNENRALFASGKCAMWIDATSAAGFIYNPKESVVADKTSFVKAPVAVTEKGSGWFWAWALSIPETSRKKKAAKSFVKWATSKEYVQLVGNTEGWVSAPPGTRKSTYETQSYIDLAPFASITKQAIINADPSSATLEPVPYTGVQYVAIPEFQGLGTFVGQQFSAALAGTISVEKALLRSHKQAKREIRRAGYKK